MDKCVRWIALQAVVRQQSLLPGGHATQSLHCIVNLSLEWLSDETLDCGGSTSTARAWKGKRRSFMSERSGLRRLSKVCRVSSILVRPTVGAVDSRGRHRNRGPTHHTSSLPLAAAGKPIPGDLRKDITRLKDEIDREDLGTVKPKVGMRRVSRLRVQCCWLASMNPLDFNAARHHDVPFFPRRRATWTTNTRWQAFGIQKFASPLPATQVLA